MKHLLLLGICGFTASAHAVDVKGTLHVSMAQDVDQAPAETQPYWEEWNGYVPLKAAKSQLQHALVVVLRSASSQPVASVKAQLWGYRFTPETVVVRPGQAIALKNSDPPSHTLRSQKLWGLETKSVNTGKVLNMAAASPGIFDVAVDGYPTQKMFIRVVEDVTATTEVATDGSYRFRRVAGGKYTLEVYFRGKRLASRKGVLVPQAPSSKKKRRKRIDDVEVAPMSVSLTSASKE